MEHQHVHVASWLFVCLLASAIILQIMIRFEQTDDELCWSDKYRCRNLGPRALFSHSPYEIDGFTTYTVNLTAVYRRNFSALLLSKRVANPEARYQLLYEAGRW